MATTHELMALTQYGRHPRWRGVRLHTVTLTVNVISLQMATVPGPQGFYDY